MADEKEIYTQDALQYEALVAREDYQGNIFSAIRTLVPFEGLNIVELGAGTGRLTCPMAASARNVWGFDLSAAMLQVAASKLRAGNGPEVGQDLPCRLAVADHRSIPVPTGWADLVISGWSVCYLAVWNPQSWRRELDRGLGEMQRVLRPGGAILLLETQGTGFTSPHPPAFLQDYYSYLEDRGFSFQWIRTDYAFTSRQEGEELSRFFFGPDMPSRLVEDPQGRILLPECTGVHFWIPIRYL